MMRIIVVAGATATGKTALSLALVERFGGEIVNADSRQIYRGMDIGTAKPTAAEQARAAHHLIDIRDPDAGFSLAEFLELAHAAIAEVAARDKVPVVVGGTGQYVRALLEGWSGPAAPPDAGLRTALQQLAQDGGGRALYAELSERDPSMAEMIDPRNVRRVVRALEIIALTGRPASEQRGRGGPVFDALVLGLAVERHPLYQRIDERVDEMFSAGLVDEVAGLIRAGYGCWLPAMQSIGYREVCGYLAGDLTLDQAVERTKTGTHRLARRQAAWFRPADPAIRWLSADEGVPVEAATTLVEEWLRGHNSAATP